MYKLKIYVVVKFQITEHEGIFFLQIGPLTDIKWKLNGSRAAEDVGHKIAIHVTPPDGEEDDEFVPPLRVRRKLSTPLSALQGADGLAALRSKGKQTNINITLDT